MLKYDVIIVGAGPAGIFTALELTKNSDLNILMLEKGKAIEKRNCPVNNKGVKCINCKPCSITCGWGGAGAFSDGKLTLTSAFGGVLDEYISKQKLEELIKYVDQVYVEFGATTEVHGTDEEKVREIERKAAAADLKLIPARVKHLGTDKCYDILRKMQYQLSEKVTIKTETPVKDILVDENTVYGVRTENGEEYYADYVVVVPGREGAEWFNEQTAKLKLKTKNNAVDIGVRVEVPAVVMEDITDAVYESKLIYFSKSFDDRVRTFCMNPYGQVVEENNNGIKTVNGHSYKDIKTQNTNFALLVSKEFTEPFKEPIAYGKYIATLANMLGEGVIVQRLGDLLDGRRSTYERIKRGLVEPTLADATPGDLSLVLPYRHLTSIIEMLQAMDKIAPGVYSKHTLLYGVEVKFYSSRVELTDKFETKIKNLFAAGDGAGITRGLAQASVSGVVVAREILNRLMGRD
ncbi:NAD(P)/FAD-dependent oxidoreductase [Caldanaerobius polysaccharolyticus]|uniref:NAD(P)/FAD-dependent oxidoreductase n=1 Tax=Caldanaerobius polysaccharolyticus TaxID=44256 RepID=UPI000555AF73|nr:NAD(P)/FAD-dependent oxidoreductase [Caldanaerobius polysaccharolyticus]